MVLGAKLALKKVGFEDNLAVRYNKPRVGLALQAAAGKGGGESGVSSSIMSFVSFRHLLENQ